MPMITDLAQRELATDVSRSVIVQAPAGSGKTTLLVERYLKLLAIADAPEEILAITFTIKAAAEMRTRVLNAMRNGDSAATAALERSRELDWKLLEQPRRLKIQTIDSFAMSLARQLPLQSGFNPNTRLIEAADDLYAEAADRVLLRLYRNDPFTEEIADFLQQCGNEQTRARRLLADMLSKRDQWLGVVSTVMKTYQEARQSVPQMLASGSLALNEDVIRAFADATTQAERDALVSLARFAATKLGISHGDEAAMYRFLGEILTTQKGSFRKQVTKREGFPAQDKPQKAELMNLLAGLQDRGLEAEIGNLRYLPEPPDDTVLDDLINACICLTLAAIELNTIFAQQQVSDFTELLLTAQGALGDSEQPTDLALALDHRINHLLIDEFQDTSVSQYRLFEQLLEGWMPGDGNTFFAVGDPMQSIYRFRDADVGLFYRAATLGFAGIQLESVSLESNFRSTPSLVDWCNRTFKAVLGDIQDAVLGAIRFSPSSAALEQSDKALSPAVSTTLSDSQALQCRQIADTIDNLLNDGSESSVAILVRSRGQLTPLLGELRSRGVSWHANDIDSLADRSVVRDLLAICRLFENHDDRLALFTVLRAPWCGLLLPDLEALAAVDNVLVADAADIPALSADGSHRLQRLQQVWRRCGRLIDEVPPRLLIEAFWLQMGGADAYTDPSLLVHADRFLQLLDTHCPSVIDSATLELAADGLFATDVTRSRLQIMTIHKAKGLEFDHVIVPFLERATRSTEAALLLWRALPDGLLLGLKGDNGIYHWLDREDKAREQHERERLFYVASTRARESLHLFATPGDKPNSRSLLALIWSQLSEEIEAGRLDITTEQPVVSQPDLFTDPVAPEPQMRSRVPVNYAWHPPVELTHLNSRETSRNDGDDGLSAQAEVALGIIVHRELEILAAQPLPDPELWATERRSNWQRQAQTLGIDEALLPELLDTIATQLKGVLADETGRWLLQARDDAHAELPLSYLSAEDKANVQHIVLDRTFREADRRWLIDYKTAIPKPDVDTEAFVREEVTRYRGQLRRYSDAAELAFAEPVQVAVYFTALPHLELIG